jgi:hypothetical protein
MRVQNKMWYGVLGLQGGWHCKRLNPYIPKICLRRCRHGAEESTRRPGGLGPVAGSAAEVSTVLPPKSKAIIVSNVNSYSGGTMPWKLPANSNTRPPSTSSAPSHDDASSNPYFVTGGPAAPVKINDGLAEVMAVGGLVDMSLLQLKIGSGADKIGQTDSLVMTVGIGPATDVPMELYVQIDGEPGPIIRSPSTVTIKGFGKTMYVRCANLEAIARDGGGKELRAAVPPPPPKRVQAPPPQVQPPPQSLI